MRWIWLQTTVVFGWWYGHNLPEKDKNSLLQLGCFHGDYGSNLTISSCARPNLTRLNASINTGLCVVQGTSIFSSSVKSDEFVVLHSEQKFSILGSPEESAYPYPQVCLEDDYDVVTVPLRSYAPPANNRKTLLEPNPKIELAVAAVSADKLKGTVTYLSSQYHTRNSLSLEALEVSKWLTAQYQSFGFTVTTFQWDPDYSPVVIAELKGKTTPDEIVIVGGHYDSRATNVRSPTERAPGADDNGSGTANLLEIARIISDLRMTFQYTIRLCSFSGEEQGLLGSRAYAAAQRQQGTKIIAMLNGDMLGYQLPNQPVALGMKDRYVSPWLLSTVNSITSLYVPTLPIRISNSCCSDHQAFTENGFPAVGFFENPGGASDYPHYHKETDLPQYLNFDQLSLESSAMLASALTFAVPI